MDNKEKYRGLSGWLILLGIGLVYSPINILITGYSAINKVLSSGAWEACTTVGERAYNPLWAPILIIENLYNLTLLISTILLIYLFFSRHHRFPVCLVVLIAIPPLFLLFDVWLTSFIRIEEPLFDPKTKLRGQETGRC